MRVFGIQNDGKFKEYVQTPFKAEHEEKLLEEWLESNPDGILEDGKLLVIGRQVKTDLGSFIDLLGIDRQGDVVVVELKRDRTPRDTVAQALEYASYVERLDGGQLESILQLYLQDESLSLAEHHHEYFGLGSDDAVSFNKDQRIVVVGQRVTPEVRQTASFLRDKGLRVTCIEFTFFQATSGTRLLSQEIVVGKEPAKPRQVISGSLPSVSRDAFVKSLDDNGKEVFKKVLDFADIKGMPVHWGAKGFSLNADVGGTHVAICFGYPPHSVFGQSIYTATRGPGGMTYKTAVPEEVLLSLESKAQSTGLFVSAGHELKCIIERRFTEQEINAIPDWCQAVSDAIIKYGLKQ